MQIIIIIIIIIIIVVSNIIIFKYKSTFEIFKVCLSPMSQ